MEKSFWSGKKVLVTGHTGFKGSWLSLWLLALGADVRGLSDEVPTTPSLFELADLKADMQSVLADICDTEALAEVVGGADVVLHLAAQPFVRRSFREPTETWRANVLGTCHLMDAAIAADVPSTVVVTSDKCYDNDDGGRAFVEADPMGGHDPYSSSKGAAEIAVSAWRRSFEMRVASGRAGNVIGGGDWGEDRLIPDIMRAAAAGHQIQIRRPDAVRPWQHVLEPLAGYLVLAQRLHEDRSFAQAFNFGPASADSKPVRWIVERLTEQWPDPLTWDIDEGTHPHEAALLALDSTKARDRLGWSPTWDLGQTLDSIVEWYVAHRDGQDMRAVTLAQIERFER
ncbi:MAG TPA: CDP-glucose 4,6-dehydratase [Baekduia sp.]|nr:CDP-glucose 4,6-dehydratase [Baekduia sp.]